MYVICHWQCLSGRAKAMNVYGIEFTIYRDATATGGEITSHKSWRRRLVAEGVGRLRKGNGTKN